MRLDIYKRKWHNLLLMFVRMDKYSIEDKDKLFHMAEDIFDLQYKFDSESLCYMLLQHARDCLLAVDEVFEL